MQNHYRAAPSIAPCLVCRSGQVASLSIQVHQDVWRPSASQGYFHGLNVFALGRGPSLVTIAYLASSQTNQMIFGLLWFPGTPGWADDIHACFIQPLRCSENFGDSAGRFVSVADFSLCMWLPVQSSQARAISPNRIATKQSLVSTRTWPDAGAPSIDFIATLPTANLCLQRHLWSCQ